VSTEELDESYVLSFLHKGSFFGRLEGYPTRVWIGLTFSQLMNLAEDEEELVLVPPPVEINRAWQALCRLFDTGYVDAGLDRGYFLTDLGRVVSSISSSRRHKASPWAL
jgi:hypothetical protein